MRTLFALWALLCAALPASAQTPVNPPRATVTIGLGEGRLFQLDRDASNVFVGNGSIASVQIASGRLIFVYGRKIGQTTVTAVGASDSIAGNMVVRVERSAEGAQAALHNSAVTLSFAGDRLVLRGPVRDVGEAMEVGSTAQSFSPNNLPPLDRSALAGAQQITLRVRIAEVSRNDLNRIGVNISAVARPGSLAVSFLTNSFLSGLSSSENALSGSVGFTNNRVNVEALVNALQREGVLTMLAEPNLTTLSGETASFLAGGEVPIPVPQSFGVTTIQYKQYGVQLAFTPTLLPGNRIAMRVRPEVSEIDAANSVTLNGNVVPAFTTRHAEANVEMASGQTIVMAGLFQRNLSDNLDRVPLLGDIPVIGALFRSQRFQRQETELMILITPYLSEPVSSPTAFALPTDDQSSRPRALPRAGFVVD